MSNFRSPAFGGFDISFPDFSLSLKRCLIYPFPKNRHLLFFILND